jgi:hypothetical protein
MRRSCVTNLTLGIAGLLTALLCVIFTLPLVAQPVHQSHPYYDTSKEVTLSGTVATVLTKPSAGMPIGSHLMLDTASGPLDASLGKWALQGKGGLSVSVGQAVELTGVMKTVKDQQVFVVRTVKADGRLYTIRNKYGVPMSPQSRERASHTAPQRGESL